MSAKKARRRGVRATAAAVPDGVTAALQAAFEAKAALAQARSERDLAAQGLAAAQQVESEAHAAVSAAEAALADRKAAALAAVQQALDNGGPAPEPPAPAPQP